MPRQSAAIDHFHRVARLLEVGRESWQAITASQEVVGKARRIPGRKAKSKPGNSSQKPATPDLLVSWGESDMDQALRLYPKAPLICGVTLSDVWQGKVPTHPRIAGYLLSGDFPRALLTDSGIPLKRQFGLVAWLETGGAPPAPKVICNERHSVLLVSDDPALTAAAKGACELLCFRLERISPKAAQALPATFYSRFDCVIAAGQLALRAVVAGAAVIVADGRGSAGRVTPNNLQRVLDAYAGPACFDSPVGAETILTALSDSVGSGPIGLDESLYQLHSESARAGQLCGWLRQSALDFASTAPADDWRDAPRPLDITAPAAKADQADGADAFSLPSAPSGGSRPRPWPECEVLVDLASPQSFTFPLPVLPSNRRLSAGDEAVLAGLFGEGWHQGEAWGRWSGSREAVLRFMTEQDEGEELELLLNLHAYLPPVRAFQRVVVNVNGQWLLSWKLDRQARDAPFRLPLHPETLGEDRVWRIRLFLPDTDTPRSWGPGDCRQLGVGLSGLEVRRAAPAVRGSAAPRLPLNQRIPTGGDKAVAGLFGQGWHRGEAWGRWSESREPTLRFECPDDEGEMELWLQLCVFLPPGRLYQRVTVSVNGWPLLCWKVDREDRKNLHRKQWNPPFRVPLPPELRRHDGVWRIGFSLPDTEIPATWGQRDGRQLGLALAGLELRRMAQIAKPLAPPSLPMDRYIPASDGKALAGLFGAGWHRGEAWGRWSESREPELRLKAEAGQGDRELLLHLCAFLPPGRLFQRVIASVNGQPAVCWRVDREARLKINRGERDAPFRLPLRQEWLTGNGLCRVRFHLPDADLPTDWGQKDERQLGLGLAGLELRQTVEPAQPLPPPRLPVGSPIPASDMNILAGFFGEGWSRVESWGRWTEKAEATLRFETETVEGEFELLFYIHTYLPPIRAFQRVIVTVNGRPRVCWKLDRQSKGLPFCLPLLREWRVASGQWRIGLSLPDADTPRAWGPGDGRQLGLGLSALELRYTLPPKNNVSYMKTS